MRGRGFVSVFRPHAGIIEPRRRLNQGQGMTFLVVTHDAHIAGGGDRVVSRGAGSYSPLTKWGHSAGSSL
jgi:ABC-type lipoprotein export system ATPase subunit